MERQKKESVLDLSTVKNVFIATNDTKNLSGLISSLPGATFFTTKSCRIAVNNCINPEDRGRILGLNQYNGIYDDEEMQAFGQPIFLGTLFRNFNMSDQRAISHNMVREPIDLVIVNFGVKKMQDLNRDELASFLILQAAIQNFSRVMVLTDPEDYTRFSNYINREGVYRDRQDTKKKFAGTTDFETRFAYAKKASAMVSEMMTIFSSSKLRDQNCETMKKIEAVAV